MKQRLYILSILLIAGLISCDSGLQGDLSENKPPTTSLTVDKINRSGANRLPSQIRISWWGDDPDGYVVGYEFAINNFADTAWTFTEKSDSTFILPIPQGNLTADVEFRVRAIDNEDARDPDPAELVYPIINSPPVIEMDNDISPPDTTYNIAAFGWIADDPDGKSNLDHIELSLNNKTDWVEISSDFETITLRTEDDIAGSTATASILIGETFSELGKGFDNFKLESENTLYVRSVDRAGAKSPVDSVNWFSRKRTSRVLLVNDIASEDGTYFRRDFHLKQLEEAGFNNVDVWNMNDGEVSAGQRVPLSTKFFDITQLGTVGALAMDQWDYIYWASSNFDRNMFYAPQMLSDLIGSGGKVIFFSGPKEIEETHPLFSFLPYDGFTPNESGANGFSIDSGSEVTPSENSNWPVLEVENNIPGGIFPIEALGGAKKLYKADFKEKIFRGSRDFTGNETIAAMSGEGNVLYFSLDISNLNVRDNVDELIRVLTVDELGFQED